MRLSSVYEEYGELKPYSITPVSKSLYFNPDFPICTYNCDQNAVPYFYLHKSKKGECYYQFLLRKIAIEGFEEFYDISTPFDYGGFYCTNKDILPDFFSYFDQFCKKNNIVSEFLRFCPTYKFPFEIISQHIDTVKIADHFYINLNENYESFFSSGRKRNIKRALSKEHEFIKGDLNSFYELYESTMNRVNASSYFYFPKSVLQKLIDKKFAEIYSLSYKNEICCSSVILLDGKIIYYFLGGSTDIPEKNDFNSLLFKYIADKFKKEDREMFFLGGGNSGVAEFKRRFTPNTLPYYIGKKIHIPKIYNEMVQSSDNTENNFFPQYRKKII